MTDMETTAMREGCIIHSSLDKGHNSDAGPQGKCWSCPGGPGSGWQAGDRTWMWFCEEEWVRDGRPAEWFRIGSFE